MPVLVDGQPLKRGDIVSVDLMGAVGAETQNDANTNVRPCIVIQNDKGNSVSPTTIVVPLSDAEKNRRALLVLVRLSSAELGPGSKDSVAHCEQVRTVDIAIRVKGRVGHVGPDVMSRIEEALAISLGR